MSIAAGKYFFKTPSAEVSFEDARVVAAEIKRRTLAPDEFVFEIASDSGGAFAPAYDEVFKVLCGGEAIFEGSIVSRKMVAKNGRKYARYVSKNAWYDLERIVFQQVWKTPSDPSSADSPLGDVLKSRVILGQNASGQKQSVSEQAVEILSYALEISGSFSLGNISLDSPMVLTKTRWVSEEQELPTLYSKI